MDTDQALSELFTAASVAMDSMAKAENSLLAFGDIEVANVLSAARVKLESAAKALSTGQNEDLAP